ncbi:Molybdopterin synthase sulfur carrier subunit [Lecanosticta acicola]|uniref:Molybdopterin synthase sulfur carrier subunit n=1 Tax=Lecanosticta acicola TaxID=111012 RepID=A0AAI8YWI2_9PEZI|nr:Molybdopterin synthase sulfur carrier subunit [Lecanosticta acicola]
MSGPKAPTGQFTLLYFAASMSYTQKEHEFFVAPLPVTKLFDQLEERYVGIQEKVLSSSAVTVNLDYVDVEEEAAKGTDGLVIREGDEVAIIPPVSSG